MLNEHDNEINKVDKLLGNLKLVNGVHQDAEKKCFLA